MPKIVEIVGPSGSGKSSVYFALKRKWNYENNWVTYSQLQFSNISTAEKIIRKAKTALNEFSPFRKKKVRSTEMKSEWKFVRNRNDTFLGDNYSEFKSVLMDLVDEHCKEGFTGADKRFITVYMVMWSMAYIDTVKQMEADDRYCILNQGEGLVSRIMHLNSPSFNDEALRKYIDAAPHPDVLFFLETDAEKILERVQSRDRWSTLHEGMNAEEILHYTKKTNYLLSLAATILEKKGVDVHRVDGSQALEKVVAEISGTLSSKGR